jgi:hypothetical protein
LDAAHIRWHQAGGPDREGNGLALCVLHHKLFDLGGFTLSGEGVLLVSDQANGSEGLHEALRHHGQRARPPQRPEHRPEAPFLDWHRKEVFKGAARHLKNLIKDRMCKNLATSTTTGTSTLSRNTFSSRAGRNPRRRVLTCPR